MIGVSGIHEVAQIVSKGQITVKARSATTREMSNKFYLTTSDFAYVRYLGPGYYSTSLE